MRILQNLSASLLLMLGEHYLKNPIFQLCYTYCITYNGEHESERGALVIAKLFAEAFSKWLTTSST